MPVKRILFVSNLYPPNAVGGYERLCADVAAAFAARGCRVGVLTASYGGRVSRHPGQTVYQALQLLIGRTIYEPFAGSEPQRAAISRANVTALRRVVDEFQPDTIFCWNLFGFAPDFVDAVVDVGIPAVAMLTDNWLIGLKQPDYLEAYTKAHIFRTGHAPPRPAAIRHLPCRAVFGSEFMRDYHTQAGLRFDGSLVVHNGVRHDIRAEGEYRDRLTLVREGEFNLLFAGRIVEIKGLHVLIEAIPLVPHASRLRLTVVGGGEDGPYLERIRRELAQFGLTDRVEFLDPVPEAALFDLFQRFDAYVFPSLYEPFSLTLILALAAGIPTIASRVGGNVEIVEEGKSGLLFEESDPESLAGAIERLMRDPALRGQLSATARVVAARFTFESMVERMYEFVAGG